MKKTRLEKIKDYLKNNDLPKEYCDSEDIHALSRLYSEVSPYYIHDSKGDSSYYAILTVYDETLGVEITLDGDYPVGDHLATAEGIEEELTRLDTLWDEKKKGLQEKLTNYRNRNTNK